MGYFDAAIQEKENRLEHSSGPWKKHKYIRKDGDKYVYSNSGLVYGDRKSAEKAAANDDFWYDENSKRSDGLSERGAQVKDYYNKHDEKYADVYKNINNVMDSEKNKRFGANGMPSNVSNKAVSIANTKFQDAIKTVKVKETLEKIERMLHQKETYQKKGMNGMPSDVINKMTKNVKRY